MTAALLNSSAQIDQIFISHYHDPKSGFTNLEDDSWWLADDQSSVSSTNRNVYLTPGSFPDSRLIQNEVCMMVFLVSSLLMCVH